MVENFKMPDPGQRLSETTLENQKKLNEEWNNLHDRLELIQRQVLYLRIILEDYKRLNESLDPQLNKGGVENYRQRLVDLKTQDEKNFQRPDEKKERLEMLESVIRHGEKFLKDLPKKREEQVVEIKKNLAKVGLSSKLDESECRTLFSAHENEVKTIQKRITEIEKYFSELRQKRISSFEIKQKNSGLNLQEGKHLGYVSEFKEEIKHYPKVLNTVLSLMDSDKLKEPSDRTEVSSAHDNGVRVVFLEKKYPSRQVVKRKGVGKLFKVTFPDLSSYFVKVHNHKEALDFYGGGYQQFSDLASVRKALAGIPFIEIIDFQLGYQDKKQAFLVAKWKDIEVSSKLFDSYLITLKFHGKRLEAEELEKQRNFLVQRLTELGRELSGAPDDPENNWGFDPKKKKFIVFDTGGRGWH